MSMLRTYCSIRLRQAFRMAKDAGWGYVLLLIPLAAVVLFALLERSIKLQRPDTAIAFLLLAASIHFYRKDHEFLARLKASPFILRSLDYFLLAIPFILSLLWLVCFKDILLLLIAIPCLAAIRPFHRISKYRSGWSLSFIPLRAFEWRAGIRRYGWLLLLVYVPSLLAVKFTGSVIIATVLLPIFALSIFDDLENKDLLEVFQPPRNFLQKKIYWQGLVFHGLMLPHYLLFLLLHTTYWYILLVAVLVAELILLFALFYKYAHWRPFRPKAYNQVATSIYVAGMIVPFLAPASLFYCWLYYRKAKKNLQYYYDKH